MIVNIIQSATPDVVEIVTPGPIGPQGPPGNSLEVGSFATTGSNTFKGNQIISGSLFVTGGISGSFSGSGANLFNIPASGITGLNLSQISSGSVSASISEQNGLQVNTKVVAPSFTGSLFGTASNSTSASYALTSSYVQNAQSASYVLQAVSSSFASTASFINSLNQNVTITGSVFITGSTNQIGNTSITGSINISGGQVNIDGVNILDTALAYAIALG